MMQVPAMRFSHSSTEISLMPKSVNLIYFEDTNAEFLKASKILEADYQVPFLAHACMEPLNATAEVSEGRCEIWWAAKTT